MATPATSPGMSIYERPAELLQQLIRFDTTNPPGEEAACVGYIRELLSAAGIESTVLALDPARPNLVARLPGSGDAPPLAFHGHVDVVTTANQDWQRPPFGGELADGYVWGRGALDMKGGVAMMLSAVLRARAEGITPPGDVLLVVLSDEEAGSDYGMKFLADQHASLFEGVRYAIGEGGGVSRYVQGQRFYPIMVAEKQICWVRATLRGPGGHASRPMRGGAMAKLGDMLLRLDRSRLPVHVLPVVRQTLETMASALPDTTASALTGMLDPARTDAVLDGMGDAAPLFDPMLHNTVNATIVHGGLKINVIPSEVVVEMDGRLLPGYGPAEMIGELREVVGEEVELEVLRYDGIAGKQDMGLFPTLESILRDADPGGVPVPMLLTAVTDGRYFAQMGIQPYGFLPLNLPEDLDAMRLIHAADERVPADALLFGADALYKLITRFGQGV